MLSILGDAEDARTGISKDEVDCWEKDVKGALLQDDGGGVLERPKRPVNAVKSLGLFRLGAEGLSCNERTARAGGTPNLFFGVAGGDAGMLSLVKSVWTNWTCAFLNGRLARLEDKAFIAGELKCHSVN